MAAPRIASARSPRLSLRRLLASFRRKRPPPIVREVAQAHALLKAGDTGGALALLRARLATGADDLAAAHCLGEALRGRADAPEAFAQALLGAIRAGQREAAQALWRELTAQGLAAPRAGAELHKLATWLRAAGASGEARGAALAALEGADAALLAKLAKEARRADPVFALRAAERAFDAPGLNGLERKALEELAAQARKDARNAGVVVLDARAEEEAAPRRLPALQRDASELAGDDGALSLDLADEEPAASPAAEAPTPFEASQTLFERGAIDLTAEPPAAPALPDPEAEGEAALVDALHAALTEAGDLGVELSADDSPDLLAESAQEPDAMTAIAPAERQAAFAFEHEHTRLEIQDDEVAPEDVSASVTPPSPDDFAFGEAADALFEPAPPEPAPPRPLHVSAAKPERLGSDAIVLEIEGRGRAQLAYAKIDAVAAAGVKGISASGKAVLLIDLAIGHAAGEGPLRVVRLRADSFDSRELVAGHTSPLAALRALVAELRERTHGTALPREASANAPFRIYADLESYEREAFR